MALTKAQLRMLNSLYPNPQRITATGTYVPSVWFLCSSANATVGATYTNNGQTFTVVATVAASNKVLCNATGAPSSSGTLTKASGTGDATITFQYARLPTYAIQEMVGPGGGGQASSSAGWGNAGSAGAGSSTFGALVTCPAGGGGNIQVDNGGSTPTVAAPCVALIIANGSPGDPGINKVSSTFEAPGGNGGASPYLGAGHGMVGATVPTAAVDGSGSGGGGAGTGSTGTNHLSGQGGGSGGYAKWMYPNPQSQTVTLPAGGGGGAGGLAAGGGGARGQFISIDFFN